MADGALRGRRILVTRARDQAPKLVALLEAEGAEAVTLPTICIAPPLDEAALDAACDGAGGADWLIFTSTNGAHAFLDRVAARRGLATLRDVRICAVGPATRRSIEEYGLRVDVTPPEYRADALVTALGGTEALHGRRVLLPRGQLARAGLIDQLRDAGADVVEVVAYRTLAEDGDAAEVVQRLRDGALDAVTFTSASTVQNFAQMVGPGRAGPLLRDTAVAAIGPVTAEAARALGLTVTILPDEYTVPGLVQALVRHFSRPHSGGTGGAAEPAPKDVPRR